MFKDYDRIRKVVEAEQDMLFLSDVTEEVNRRVRSESPIRGLVTVTERDEGEEVEHYTYTWMDADEQQVATLPGLGHKASIIEGASSSVPVYPRMFKFSVSTDWQERKDYFLEAAIHKVVKSVIDVEVRAFVELVMSFAESNRNTNMVTADDISFDFLETWKGYSAENSRPLNALVVSPVQFVALSYFGRIQAVPRSNVYTMSFDKLRSAALDVVVVDGLQAGGKYNAKENSDQIVGIYRPDQTLKIDVVPFKAYLDKKQLLDYGREGIRGTGRMGLTCLDGAGLYLGKTRGIR